MAADVPDPPVTVASAAGVQTPAPSAPVAGASWAGVTIGRSAVGVTARDIVADDVRLGRAIVWRPVRAAAPPASLAALAQLACGPAASALCVVDRQAGPTGARASGDPALLAGPGGAHVDGSRPLVVAVGSSASRGLEFVALAEALASHGLVVAEVVPEPATSSPAFDDAALARGLSRLERAVEVLGREPGIDAGRLGVIAWSFGGVPGSLLACRRARGFVSLDSAMRYRYGTDLLRARRFEPGTCTADLLAVAAGIGNQVPTDTTENGWPPARAGRYVGHDLTHGDFSDRHGALAVRPADDAAAFRRRYGRVANEVVAFLVARLPAAALSAPAAR